MPFSVAVTSSLRKAAAAVGVDLLIRRRHRQCGEPFIRERVDVVIEFQVRQRAAPVIADKIVSAAIPMIAVEIPHPHSTYCGIDNYRAGVDAGSLLGDFANKQWGGKVDWVIGLHLDVASAGAEPDYGLI